jgi:hypothetical protein
MLHPRVFAAEPAELHGSQRQQNQYRNEETELYGNIAPPAAA